MKKSGKQERTSQPRWSPNKNKLHKAPVPQVSDGVGKRKNSTKND